MARQHYEGQIADREAQIKQLKSESKAWANRVSMLQNEHIDKDLLEERALAVLNAGHQNDVIVLFPDSASGQKAAINPPAQ